MDHQNIINYSLLLLQSFAVMFRDYIKMFEKMNIIITLHKEWSWAVWKDRYEVKVRPRLKPPHQVSSAWSSTPITFNPKPLSCVPTLVLHPDYCRCYSFLQHGIAFHLSWLELQTNHRKVFTITEKAPTNAFTIQTILRHYAKWILT